MFAHLLVPLDGSHLAESVLPAAQALAGRFRSRVTLLHVVERRPPTAVHGDRHLRSVPEAEAYLAGVAARTFDGLRTATHVHGAEAADVATLIARHAEELRADLIVLCTHGTGGARDLLYGSVAQQVLNRGGAPILLVKPGGAGRAATFERIVVPLDGSPPSEAALPAAESLARAFAGRLILVLVVPTLATVPTDRSPAALLLPSATTASLELEAEAAQTYLAGVAARLRAGGVAAEVQVGRGDPALEVLEAAERFDADLLVVATHGRSGMSAVWAGSVAMRIVARCRRPMLLVRAPGVPVTP
ncbi:MAG: universal stress protein [Armatimonadota bacterium]|nr:universal stress protein [Armatimonadota bacterium]